jgi:DUF1365 family protein
MHSCIYEGWVRHRRFRPVEHSFRNHLFLLYLDLSEIDTVFAKYWGWSSKRIALARFKRSDHFGDPNVSLDETVRDFVEQRGQPRPTGPIRLLTNLRYFGYVFNPVTFFYCFDFEERLEYVVAQVTNTPWGERHCYLVSRDQFAATEAQPSSGKDFHVSPFMPMDLEYCWQLIPPADKLTVRIANFQKTESKSHEAFFDATMQMSKREINSWQLARVLFRYPLMTVQVVANIYWQAFRLWRKGCPFYSHPKKNTVATPPTVGPISEDSRIDQIQPDEVEVRK